MFFLLEPFYINYSINWFEINTELYYHYYNNNYYYYTQSHDRAKRSLMHSILKVQRISHRCATDTVYRLVTIEEGRVEAQILMSDQI